MRRGRTGLSVATGACLAVAAMAPAAYASQASFSGDTVTVTANPGETNTVSVNMDEEIEDRAGITAGPGCEALSSTKVQCAPVDEGEYNGITYGHYDAVQVTLGDGNDALDVTNHFVRTTVDAGDGNDRIAIYGSVATVDAGSGDDTVRGSSGDDNLMGGPGNDTVEGARGNDTVDGGPGRDTLLGDSDLEGNGNDRLLARDGEQDQVSCNLGSDIVTADKVDVVEEPSCELVERGTAANSPASPQSRFAKKCAKAGNAKQRRVCVRRAKAIAKCKTIKGSSKKAKRRKATCTRKAKRIGASKKARRSVVGTT